MKINFRKPDFKIDEEIRDKVITHMVVLGFVGLLGTLMAGTMEIERILIGVGVYFYSLFLAIPALIYKGFDNYVKWIHKVFFFLCYALYVFAGLSLFFGLLNKSLSI